MDGEITKSAWDRKAGKGCETNPKIKYNFLLFQMTSNSLKDPRTWLSIVSRQYFEKKCGKKCQFGPKMAKNGIKLEFSQKGLDRFS